MATSQTSAFCKRCKEQTLHTKEIKSPNHVLHLLISLLLCGFWLPVWLLIALFDNGGNAPFRCSRCGSAGKKR